MTQQSKTVGNGSNNRAALARYAWISIGASILTILLKSLAYLLTNSVGFLSDAVESIVNLVAGFMALAMLTVAARPADEIHAYGHSKAEYFSSTTEGILILVAAGGIITTAVRRFLAPQPLEQLGIGVALSVVASLVNFFAARILLKTGKRENSITLEADAHHLMTDVWTSLGVITGMAIVALTGWQTIDPIVAVLVGLNIIWTAYQLLRRSVAGLMDASLPVKEQKIIMDVMEKFRGKGVVFHSLRTRQSAAQRFLSVHMRAPGTWTLHEAHHVAEDFEHAVRDELPDAVILTDIEPADENALKKDDRESTG